MLDGRTLADPIGKEEQWISATGVVVIGGSGINQAAAEAFAAGGASVHR
jgi:hypothetical protein